MPLRDTGGTESWLHSFLTSALKGGDVISIMSQLFYPWETTLLTKRTGGLVGRKASTECFGEGDLLLCQERNPGLVSLQPCRYTDYATLAPQD